MDRSFSAEAEGLQLALDLLRAGPGEGQATALPERMPERGLGEIQTLAMLAPLVLGQATPLGAATAFAQMDPPTPWNASLNQNLLHPATAPVARNIEQLAIGWLAPYFGMQGGHMTPGCTAANLTGLWAARENAGVTEVIASEGAHLSIAKAAHLLGLRYRTIASDRTGAMIAEALEGDLSRTVLVLTAGTTSGGRLDPLTLAGKAGWTHIDAAWAGPLRLSARHANLLAGIERADSVAVSAHEWLFQPKESAFVLFRDVASAHAAVSFGGAYLATPNIGVLGSHGAAATPLAWGGTGVASRIDRCMEMAERLAEFVAQDADLELLARPETGVVNWRPRVVERMDEFYGRLPEGSTSRTVIAEEPWFRNVAANPNFNVGAFLVQLRGANLASRRPSPAPLLR